MTSVLIREAEGYFGGGGRGERDEDEGGGGGGKGGGREGIEKDLDAGLEDSSEEAVNQEMSGPSRSRKHQ